MEQMLTDFADIPQRKSRQRTDFPSKVNNKNVYKTTC